MHPCPEWVKPGLQGLFAPSPLRRRKRNSKRHSPMSQSCQRRTPAPQQRASSLDHLVRAPLELQRHVEAERLGGLEVDHQLELDWGLDGKLARVRASQDAIDIGRGKPKQIALLTSVRQQAAEFSEETP